MEWETKDSLDLIKTWVSDFDPEKVKEAVLNENIGYLEKTIVMLESHRTKYEGEQKTAASARSRGIARDKEKSIAGFIDGIKFGISFLLYGKQENLNETDNLS